VILSGNAGFGVANNVAAGYARSDRILFVNPDVFPRDQDWPMRHSAILGDLPAAQTKIFGVPLYYDDGSLMHSGMYFDFDTGLSIHNTQIERVDMIRIEHYAKGAPPEIHGFLTSRPVPAVTGAFLSIDRGWFEKLGGFSPEYVFGHYEDADLCLRSLQQGQPSWVHSVKLWHLEGKGSVRHPAHDGASIVNRWHFTDSWRVFILDGLVGRFPARLPAALTEGVDTGGNLRASMSRRAGRR
jgi:GT2 family glycosyltransferase